MIKRIYIGQYVNPSNDLKPTPMINSREMRILHNNFQCKYKFYGKVGDCLEINEGSKCASLFDPLTLIVNAEDETECESFTNDIANSINKDQEPDKQIMFELAKGRNNKNSITREYMEEFIQIIEQNSAKEAKTSRKFSIMLTILGILGGLAGGVAISYLLPFI